MIQFYTELHNVGIQIASLQEINILLLEFDKYHEQLYLLNNI